jgi:predicted regulator of Ras-like GTPase activity (Roadblock/LC7/MglB family)
VGQDGFLLSSIEAGAGDPEGIAASSAIAALTSERIGAPLSLGKLSWILLEFTHGKMVIARKNEKIWVVAANEHVVIGDVLQKLQSNDDLREPADMA